jgi:alkylation response protein AidB-like acyl-CoA dehydrogenase
MDLNYSDEDRQFRQRARDWLQDNVPTQARPAEGAEAASYDMEWQRRLFDGGFAGINWPKAYGGLGLTGVQQIIWFEEAMSANAPHPGAMSIALNHAGPTLIVRGREDQQAQHLPSILRGETVWCQGFSEPGAGSDLAALRTRARLDGDHFVVDGQKMWTSNAHHARYQELLVRTDPESKRHRGLTWLICDMNTPGIEIKPIKNMMGERHVNALFYDNVRIPVSNVVGEVGQGWSVAMSTLSFERGTYFVPEQISLLQKVEEVAGLARRVRLETGKLAIDDDSIAQRLAEMKARTLALRALTLSTVGSLAGKAQPGPEGSVVKLYLTTTYQELSRLAAEIINWNFLDYGADRKSNRWTYEFMWSWVLTIAGGSSEIQREIIADKILELPRAR